MALDIRAETLYKKTNTYKVKLLIDELYKSISHKIIEAHGAGHSELKYDLPDTFNVGNLEPDDAQLVVYSTIIERIESNGLNVGLIRNIDNSSTLKIRWPSVLDQSERKRMANVIVKHLIKE